MATNDVAAAAKEAELIRILVDRLRRRTCVLLLGPGVAVDPDDPDQTPLARTLARTLAADPEISTEVGAKDADNLRYVSEVYARQLDRERLELRVADFYARYQDRTTDLHRHLAALPFRVFINTSPDPMMASALREILGQRPNVSHYSFRRTVEPAPREPSDDAPLVYDLYGEPTDGESLVLGESDLLDFLVSVVRNQPPLPNWLRALLQDPGTGFLFLGFGFQNWYLRVVLHALGMIRSHRTGYALEDRSFFSHPEFEQTVGFFKRTGSGGIQFQASAWSDFAARLHAAYADAQAAAARPATSRGSAAGRGRPTVFLSYASDDQQQADLLVARLEARGLHVWQDKTSLRCGDNWPAQIDRVIGKVADYVVVLQSASMRTRRQGVYNEEITSALERQAQQGQGRRFLLCVRIDDGPPLERLAQLHCIDVRQETGVDQLTRSIEEDWAVPDTDHAQARSLA